MIDLITGLLVVLCCAFAIFVWKKEGIVLGIISVFIAAYVGVVFVQALAYRSLDSAFEAASAHLFVGWSLADQDVSAGAFWLSVLMFTFLIGLGSGVLLARPVNVRIRAESCNEVRGNWWGYLLIVAYAFSVSVLFVTKASFAGTVGGGLPGRVQGILYLTATTWGPLVVTAAMFVLQDTGRVRHQALLLTVWLIMIVLTVLATGMRGSILMSVLGIAVWVTRAVPSRSILVFLVVAFALPFPALYGAVMEYRIAELGGYSDGEGSTWWNVLFRFPGAIQFAMLELAGYPALYDISLWENLSQGGWTKAYTEDVIGFGRLDAPHLSSAGLGALFNAKFGGGIAASLLFLIGCILRMICASRRLVFAGPHVKVMIAGAVIYGFVLPVVVEGGAERMWVPLFSVAGSLFLLWYFSIRRREDRAGLQTRN